ncbi:glycoside hydrolase family 35 protein [Tessaracoccus defluvii]|uniref:glycoside hydrolase family 35 protein n=1 Tax=Tessaracoccus defluvii TaxID=1285901 RepID=UPI001D0460E8|nr:beta-galactosidase family protein [Tessaracoccus defluvii]
MGRQPLLPRRRPHQVLAGSLHYFRVHPDQWRDRLQRLIDLGLNTVDTYVAWNFHQATKDAAADFTGWRDLRRFLEIAAEVGLDAIVRPGPYICAEWANGGLPVWITRGGAPLRTIRGDFLARVADWFDVLLPQFVDLQAGRGGNVVAVQVENEFGSYGNDGDYVAAMAELLRERGITELLFTADGPTDPMLTEGTTPGVLAAVTLGSKPAEARALVRTHRPDEPFFVAEFWNGWFDHWGTNHHVRTPENAAANLAEIISDGGSVSIYMAHGGTNFGLWAGANRVDGRIRSTITSYDSDAPIAEDGTLTAKFHAMREVLGATAPSSANLRRSCPRQPSRSVPAPACPPCCARSPATRSRSRRPAPSRICRGCPPQWSTGPTSGSRPATSTSSSRASPTAPRCSATTSP